MKVLTVFGTRPEAIKLAPVLRELDRRSTVAELRTVVCVTAQHRHMLDQVLDLFEIRPDYDLNVMIEDQTPTRTAATILSQLEPVLQTENPAWVLVQGDTTTAAAASLAAFYSRAKVGHVEAGLRTHKKWQPFPEEINRRVIGMIADLHFAPTERARQNLLREGVHGDHILVTGNPVIDALRWVASLPSRKASHDVRRSTSGCPEVKIILVTAHRRESFGKPLENICLALREVARRYGDRIRVIYPVHSNPNVWGPVHRMLGDVPNIILIPPVDYLEFVNLMKSSHLVMTDSGGIQEEAPSLGKPVLVLRNVTERPEAEEAGAVKVVGTDTDRILAATTSLLEDSGEYQRMARAVNPFGDGNAAERIVRGLLGEPIPHWDIKDQESGAQSPGLF